MRRLLREEGQRGRETAGRVEKGDDDEIILNPNTRHQSYEIMVSFIHTLVSEENKPTGKEKPE